MRAVVYVELETGQLLCLGIKEKCSVVQVEPRTRQLCLGMRNACISRKNGWLQMHQGFTIFFEIVLRWGKLQGRQSKDKGEQKFKN